MIGNILAKVIHHTVMEAAHHAGTHSMTHTAEENHSPSKKARGKKNYEQAAKTRQLALYVTALQLRYQQSGQIPLFDRNPELSESQIISMLKASPDRDWELTYPLEFLFLYFKYKRSDLYFDLLNRWEARTREMERRKAKVEAERKAKEQFWNSLSTFQKIGWRFLKGLEALMIFLLLTGILAAIGFAIYWFLKMLHWLEEH